MCVVYPSHIGVADGLVFCITCCLHSHPVYYQGWLLEYFTSRDVTLNEVLILKEGPGTAMFYYTRDAFTDAQLQLVSLSGWQ